MKKKNQDNQDADFTDVLKKFSPGTLIRTALDDIMCAQMGALIVVEKEGLLNICEGGFRVNCKFSPQRLLELAKMDGAIIVSSDLKKIIYANVLLSPNMNIVSKETGTRHKAAERTAKQIETIVVAISERKNKTTVYFKEESCELEKSSEVLRRATETLQILEKQKEIFTDAVVNLNILEINAFVKMSDVCLVLQRIEIIRRISDTIKAYLIELGKEGGIISMRLKELTKNLNSEKEDILHDYFSAEYARVKTTLENMSFDFLIEPLNISRMLFEELHDKEIPSKGLRILSKTNLLEKDVQVLLHNFKTLDKIFNMEKELLLEVFKNENLVDSMIDELAELKEKIMSGKSV